MKRKITYSIFARALAIIVLPSLWGSLPFGESGEWGGVRCFAQASVSPFLIGSTGNYSEVSGVISISSSVGEAVVPTFTATGSPAVKYLTQGFQQTFAACPTVSGLNATSTVTICPGSNVTIYPNMSGGTPPITYFWNTSPIQTTSNIIVAPSITTAYTFSVVNCPGTAFTHTVNVHPIIPAPTVTASQTTICAGQSSSLSATTTGATGYNWMGPNAFSSTEQIVNVQPTGSATYSVVATDSVTTCSSDTGIFLVTVTPNPTLNISKTNVQCGIPCSGTATVSPTPSTGSYTYFWERSPSYSASTQNITGLCPGIYSVTVTDGNGCSATEMDSIRPQLLLDSISKLNAGCFCDGNATAHHIGGIAPYSYLWSPGNATTKSISGLCGGNYSVTVTDGSGCSKTDSIVIFQPSAVTINTTFPATICAGSSTTIGIAVPGNNLSYSWFPINPPLPPDSIISVSPTNPTTYTVIVSNPAGTCKDTAYIPVTVNPTPTVTISGTATVCSGQSATLTALAVNSSYQWNPGGQTGTPITSSLSGPTTFTVIATNNFGCKDTSTFPVVVIQTPTASITASPPTVCSGGISTLTASGVGGYQWNTLETTPIIFTPPLTFPANYTVTVSNGPCSSTASVTVNVTNFNASISITNNDSALCVGDNATLTATSGGTSYSWNTSPPQTTPNITISPLITTTYVVTITTFGGCTVTDNIVVSVTALPTPTIISSDTVVCQFQPVTLTASGGGNYQWLGGPSAPTYNVNPSTPGNNNYSVTVTNGGCSAGTFINIFAHALPAVTANANPNAICPGDTVALTSSASSGTPPFTYGWSVSPFLGQNISVVPTSATTYTVGVVDGNGCSNFNTVNITMNTISVDAGPAITICPGFTVALNAIISGSISGASYLWSPDSLLNDPTAQNPSANPDTSTLFSVTVTNGSCSASDTVMVYTISTPTCTIYVYNGITPNGDNDNNSWYIDGIQAFPENKVLIFNRWGTRVWGAEGYNNKEVIWNGSNDLGEPLPDGTYYYLIELYDGKGGTIYSESKWVEVTH